MYATHGVAENLGVWLWVRTWGGLGVREKPSGCEARRQRPPARGESTRPPPPSAPPCAAASLLFYGFGLRVSGIGCKVEGFGFGVWRGGDRQSGGGRWATRHAREARAQRRGAHPRQPCAVASLHRCKLLPGRHQPASEFGLVGVSPPPPSDNTGLGCVCYTHVATNHCPRTLPRDPH